MANNLNWTTRVAQKGPKAALENFANVAYGANGIALAFKALLPFFNADDAKDVYLHTQALLAAKNKALGIKTAKVEYKASRGSEIASVLKLRDWTCHNQLLDMLASLDAPRDTIVFVAREVRKGKGKIEKNAACPKRDVVVKWINDRKRQRNNEGASEARPVNPVVAIDAIAAHLKKLNAAFGKQPGNAFITAMVKACNSYKPFAAAVVKARKAESEKAKASKKK
jgi:hypothetical protein